MANPENIEPHRWKKGDSSPNPAGKIKGTVSSATIIRKWLEAKEKAKNPLNGKEQKLTQMDIMVLKQLERARKGDTAAFKELLDRMEGKAMQRQEITGKEGAPISITLNPEEIKRISDAIEKEI